MICDKCGAEMTPAEKFRLSFTSPRFEENGFFSVPKEYRSAVKYICGCGNVQYCPESPEDGEEKE
ncbi:MAG: hypothetical protein MJ079_04300 [Ruminococcus sp.]|nr:hypothetical protein [Ruminococcus sp.]